MRYAILVEILDEVRDLTRVPSLKQLARQARVDPAHVARAFRQIEGCTIGEYHRRLRISAACRLIQDPSLSLSQIALLSGFSDQAHFSRVFKRQLGRSPREYRAAIRARVATPATPELGFDPAGLYTFTSHSANGTPYEGVLEILSSPTGYRGVIRTSIMPDVPVESIAIHGRRMVITAAVPAGLAVAQLQFVRQRFSGEWRLAGRATPLAGQRASESSSSSRQS